MAFTGSYLTVQEFKDRIGRQAADAAIDAQITVVLTAASRQVDRHCGRSFGQDGTVPAPATRYVSLPLDPRWVDVRPFPTWQPITGLDSVDIPDTVSLAEVATDADGDGTWETVWTAAEWALLPRNAPATSEPYYRLMTTQAATHTFPSGTDAIRLSGIFGWPEVPEEIVEATFLLANRGKHLWMAPFGQTGAGELGAGLNMTAALTPLIKEMLSPYRAVVL